MNNEIKELKEYYHVTKSHGKRVSDFKEFLLTSRNPAEAIELHSAIFGLYLAFNISLRKAIELVYEFMRGERVLILNMTPIVSKDCILYLKHKIPLFFKNDVGCYDEEKNVFINGPIGYPFFGLTQKYYSNKSISDSTLLMEAIPMFIETCEYFNIGYKELLDLVYKPEPTNEDNFINAVITINNYNCVFANFEHRRTNYINTLKGFNAIGDLLNYLINIHTKDKNEFNISETLSEMGDLISGKSMLAIRLFNVNERHDEISSFIKNDLGVQLKEFVILNGNYKIYGTADIESLILDLTYPLLEKYLQTSTKILYVLPLIMEISKKYNIKYNDLVEEINNLNSTPTDELKDILNGVDYAEKILNHKGDYDVDDVSKALEFIANDSTKIYESKEHFPHGNLVYTADEFAKVHNLVNEENTHDFTLGIDLVNYGHRAQMVGEHMVNEYTVSVTANGVSYGQNPFPFKDLSKLKLPYFVELKFTPSSTINAIEVSVGNMGIGIIETYDSSLPNKISFEQLNSFSKMLNDIKKIVTDYLIKEKIAKPIIHSF